MNWLYRQKALLEKRLFPGRAQRWRRWKQHDSANHAAIDHAPLARLFSRYVRPASDGATRVAYGEFEAADIAALESYLAACARVAISSFDRAEQFAFWANVYNATTLRLVLRNYPVTSIRRIGLLPIWLGGGPWNKPVITVEGAALSLNDIEHRILRRNWRDPLIHYAVNCASLGCPNLRPTPFSGRALSAELEQAARDFVNSPRGVRFEPDGLSVCSIYVWFKEDFGNSDSGVFEHLRRYATAPLAGRLAGIGAIARHHYDWRLNDAAGS